MISTRNLRDLTDIDGLRRLLKSLATLDLIICPEWEYRYYSFNSKWDENEQMGSMRNGSGDEFFAWFTKAGCFFKGFDHECEMSSWATDNQLPWPNVYEGVPDSLRAALNEPAFSIGSVSFCFWRLYGDKMWNLGEIDFHNTDDPDGSEYMLEILNGDPVVYQSFAEEYYEQEMPLWAIKEVYAHRPLTEEIVQALNPEATLESMAGELEEIGYPEI